MSRRQPFLRYDLFKLVVAALLLILLLWLLLGSTRQAASNARPSGEAAPTIPPPPRETAGGALLALPEEAARPFPTATTLLAGTGQAPTWPQPSPTSDVDLVTPSPPEAAQGNVDCPLAAPTRLKAGIRARVTAPLHLRSAPEISSNLIVTNPAGTELEIIGGPVCSPYEGGAHLWWEARLADGRTGWSAEASAKGETYLLEPVE